MNENTPIGVFGSRPEYVERDTREETQAAGVVAEQVLAQASQEYYRAKFRIDRDQDETPQSLVVYLLRSDTYTAEVVRVDIDSDYRAEGVTYDYEDPPVGQRGEVDQGPAAFDDVDFVFATPCDDIATAKSAVEALYDMAVQRGLKAKKLVGSDASVANYKTYLSSGLQGFVNVGHGNPNLIVLDDGVLPASWFENMANQPVAPAVVYFNSCQVFNPPLRPAVMHAGARTFIGGVVNLLIGPSEEVCKCFWGDALKTNKPMGDALRSCEQAKYPNQGAHGITGAVGPFKEKPKPKGSLFRYWNGGITDHFYTTNWRELQSGGRGWRFEGTQCYVHTRRVAGSVPLYRYWNSKIGDHFYTTSWREIGRGRYGYRYEGVQCFVFPKPKDGTLPLFRYWNSRGGDHFYTTNWNELRAGKSDYQLEGIQCYVLVRPPAYDDPGPGVGEEEAGTEQDAPAEEDLLDDVVPGTFETAVGEAAIAPDPDAQSWTPTWSDEASASDGP